MPASVPGKPMGPWQLTKGIESSTLRRNGKRVDFPKVLLAKSKLDLGDLTPPPLPACNRENQDYSLGLWIV